ncbi:hypothetical protein [Aquimarina spongiae]|uniref:Uncharacterized protein n=1 Tax=Aquimarina spongiae TaxID=570521 RepID=A0A1M6JE10_9FLAO|nr:hypothetical protein [Aquimarina spongiae]SHJ44918.1 hypothetical protein SAMN04488508_10914 [Aquimarina spongiae]
MPSKTIKMDGREYYVVDKAVMKDLVHEAYIKEKTTTNQSVCTAKKAKEILGCRTTKFYQIQKDPKCKLRKSTVKGKYILASVHEELKRISNS